VGFTRAQHDRFMIRLNLRKHSPRPDPPGHLGEFDRAE
jgi:hypothetical protein